jgi:hypothetical protein
MKRDSATRLKAVMQPKGKTFTAKGKAELGNGEPCPAEGHGVMYVLPSGRQYCPHHSHDAERIKQKP